MASATVLEQCTASTTVLAPRTTSPEAKMVPRMVVGLSRVCFHQAALFVPDLLRSNTVVTRSSCSWGRQTPGPMAMTLHRIGRGSRENCLPLFAGRLMASGRILSVLADGGGTPLLPGGFPHHAGGGTPLLPGSPRPPRRTPPRAGWRPARVCGHKW